VTLCEFIGVLQYTCQVLGENVMQNPFIESTLTGGIALCTTELTGMLSTV